MIDSNRNRHQYQLQIQPYDGTEQCEFHELELHDPDATVDDLLMIPDAFLTDLGRCSRSATMLIRIIDNYGDDVSFFCDQHANEQINAFRRDFPLSSAD